MQRSVQEAVSRVGQLHVEERRLETTLDLVAIRRRGGKKLTLAEAHQRLGREGHAISYRHRGRPRLIRAQSLPKDPLKDCSKHLKALEYKITYVICDCDSDYMCSHGIFINILVRRTTA